MDIFKIIKYEGDNTTLVWKFPGEDFSTLSQLIVHESQEAVFFKDGKILDIFGAGRYTLHSQNIPLIRKLVGIPFSGESPFHCEVYFVNKAVSMDVRWQIPSPIPIQDIIYKVILPISAKGQFAVQVINSKKLLVKLVGTTDDFNQITLATYFKGILLMHIKDCIVKQFSDKQISFLEVQSHLLELSRGIEEELAEEFEIYGLRLVNFNVFDIAPPDNDPSYIQLRNALAKRAEMSVMGYSYQQERTFDVLDVAAANEGTSSDIMGVGMGLGLGVNLGGMVGGIMENNMGMLPQIPGTTISGSTCPKCGANVLANAKFCLKCGTPTGTDNKDDIICPACKKKVPKGRFCIECGKKLYLDCPKCGASLESGSKFCISCGTKLK